MRKSKVPPVKCAAVVGEALHEGAEHHALREGRDAASRNGRRSPSRLRALGLEAELEGDAAEDERDQHRGDRQVEGRHQDRVGEVEDREEPAAAEDEPGLVAVPDRRHREHHAVAPVLVARGLEEDADAEVEAVDDDVHGHREGDEPGPDQRQPEGEAFEYSHSESEHAAPPHISGLAWSRARGRGRGPIRGSRPGTESGRFGLLVGAVAEIVAAHRLLERLRPFSQELREVVAAEAEDEGVDHDERDERAEHRAGASRARPRRRCAGGRRRRRAGVRSRP